MDGMIQETGQRRFSPHALGSLLLSVCVTFGLAAASSAATLISDGFGDGDRDNDGVSDITDGSAIDDAGDVGASFWKAKGSSNQAFDLVNDAAGLGSGLALRNTPAGASSPTIVAHYTRTTLNDGDRISLSFDARITDPPSSFEDRRFRWGLFASNSTTENDYTKTNDGGSVADNVNHWSGFIGRVDVGPGSPGYFSINQNNAGSLLSADEFLVGDDENAQLALDDADPHHFTLTLERIADHVIVTATIDGFELSKSTLEDLNDGGAIGPISFDFDSLAIGYNSFNDSPFLIDNVVVEYTPVPEPATLVLGGLGALAVIVRRRAR